jgi:hypothetical protein
MSDMPQNDGGNSVVRTILTVAVVVYMIGSAIFMVMAQIHLGDLEKAQSESQKALAKMTEDNGKLQAQVSVLAGNVGMTQKDLSKRAAVLQSEEKATQSRLKADEENTQKQFGEVNGAVNGVRSDVNGVKGDVSKIGADLGDTKTDLATTKGRLEHAIGDLNRHNELIATNHDELEVLKHRGDRDYVEFTLKKGGQPMHVSSVALELKKADPKKSQFTLYVMADDKKIEKKDRSINEPLQFYTGRDRNLFEVVINAVDKNTVSGYLSAPKNMASVVRPDPRAPAPQ